MLTELDAEEFILVGALAEGAITATALGLLARQKKVTIVRDGAGLLNRRAAGRALRRVRARGARMITTEKLLGHSSLNCALAHC